MVKGKVTKKQVSTKQILTVLNILNKNHGQTMLEQLKHFTPFQLVVSTLLSSRTKDTTTIPIVKKLFKNYPNPEDFVKLDQRELEKKLYKIGFYKTKAKHVKELAKKVIKDYDGKVPNTLDGLLSLSGVGRKTANCVLSYAFNIPAIGVDVHVHRISNKERLAWINTKTPEESEQALMKLVPMNKWIEVNKLFVDFGQRVCLPVKPRCFECPIVKYCKYKYKNLDS